MDKSPCLTSKLSIKRPCSSISIAILLVRWNVGTCDTSVAEACLEIRLPQGPVALAGLRARFAVHQHCHSGRLEVTVGAAVGDATVRTWG